MIIQRDKLTVQNEYNDKYGNQNMDRNELFELYKENEGVEYVEMVKKSVVCSSNGRKI